jgi:hypothetical protein
MARFHLVRPLRKPRLSQSTSTAPTFQQAPPLHHSVHHPHNAPLLPCCAARQAGLDSLAALELRAALSSHFQLDLPATVTFDHPTLRALGGHIARQLAAGSVRAAAGDAGGWQEDEEARSDWEAGWEEGGMVERLPGSFMAPHGANPPLVTDLAGVGCSFPTAASASSPAGEACWEAAAGVRYAKPLAALINTQPSTPAPDHPADTSRF